MDYEANIGLSRLQIREIAKVIRRKLNIQTVLFPVLNVLERLTDKFTNLYYIVSPDYEFEKGVMAELVLEDNEYCIRMPESVYNNAAKGNRSYLGFICHEICHFVLIHIVGVGPVIETYKNGMVFFRKIENHKVPLYKSMEWQAKALCGELMIPFDKCKNYTFEQIVSETKSSDLQAKYFLEYVANYKEPNKLIKNGSNQCNDLNHNRQHVIMPPRQIHNNITVFKKSTFLKFDAKKNKDRK